MGLLVALSVARCDKSPPLPPRPDARAAGLGPGFGVLPPTIVQQIDSIRDGGELPAGPLAGPLAACVRRSQQSLSSELSSALSALAYESFTEDSCRLSLAATTRDPELCEPIQLPQLQRSCRTRVAIARADRALCPRALDEPGPDPMCVALASRAFSACPGAGVIEGEFCRAIAEHDLARCRALPGPLRRRCEEDVRVLSPLFAAERRPQPSAGRLSLTIEWVDGRDPPRTIDAEGMQRGALVSTTRAIYLLDPRRRWPSATAYAIDGRSAAVGVELSLDEQRRGVVQRLRVVLPDGRAIDGPEGHPAGTVRYGHASREVGHELSGELDASGTCVGRAVRVRGTFVTFVRDVVSDREARDGAALAAADRDGGAEDEP